MPFPSTAATATAQRQPKMQLLRVVLCLALLLAPKYACHASDDPHHLGEGDFPHAHDNDRNPYFAPYLLPGELPEGRTKMLFREEWRIIGQQLDTPDFTDKVAEVSKTIYSAYSYHGHLHSFAVSTAAPTMLDGQAVSAEALTEDDFSCQVLADFDSVNVLIEVSIDNKAWFPELGYMAATTHDRLKNIMNSEGYNVVSWLSSRYDLTIYGRIILGHMPTPEYESFLVNLKVTGANLVPFTLQKQNAVSATVADLLPSVFSVRLVSVEQNSPEAGQNISSAEVSLVVQQGASAIPVELALMGVITDPLGIPLFDARMAAAGLPLSADISSITDYWDDSITDQIIPPPDGAPPMEWFQMAGLLIGIGALAAVAAALSVALQKRRARAAAAHQLQTTPRLSHHGAELSAKTAKLAQPEVEMAGPSCEAGSVMAAPQAQLQLYDEQLNLSLWSENAPLLLNQQHQQPFPSDWAGGQLASGAERAHGSLEASSYYPFREDSCSIQHGQLSTRNCSSNSNSSSDHSLSLSQVEFSSEHGQLHPVQSQGQGQLSFVPGQLKSSLGQGQDQGQLPGPSSGPVQAWVINPEQIKICEHPRGGPWQLGSGSFGVVYKAKKGMQDVAVKTIHSRLVSPHVPVSEAADNIDRELQMWKVLSFDKNLVQFYGSCEQDGKVLLVLEYMEGGDLRHALKGLGSKAAQLRWHNKGAHIALDVIKGLHFLHTHGVLHRDIKSGNVLLSGDYSQAKICDVGLAHIMGSTSNTGHSVQATFAYAAPEMLFNHKCNEKADIFSYGIVLWEIITQETPQRGTLRDIQVPEECPQAIADLVDRCLNESPAARPTAQQIFDIISSTL
ncbi:TPA: hypothetical protein ACH3X2_004890 [Trebouxia sp. C0005]